ncbi:MAG: TonB-dependent receptor [Candidatus Acidiferrales bacterium]
MRVRRCLHIGVVFLATLAWGVSAWGQASSSSLNGEVTDPSGAPIPGATVTILLSSTGFTRSTTTNRHGDYEFATLQPGDYRISVTARGFATAVQESLALLVNVPATLNVAMEVAGQATTVRVQGSTVPLLNTIDASIGNVLGQGQIGELPIADRNVVQLLSLQPGVVYLGSALDTSSTDTRSGAVNGIRGDQSNVTLDGINVNDQNNGYAFTSVLTIPPDSVQEFRVTTANANADAGYSSGAQVALVTKSGTNDFHGSVYEYNRNTIFSANDPFLKGAQQASGQPNHAPKLLRNVFGATFGGPMVHNRLFFFLNYEGRRDAEGVNVVRTVPSAALRNGYISYEMAAGANASTCPTPVAAGSNVCTLGPAQFQQMDPQGIGPNSAMLKVLNQYPMSNDQTVGDGLNILGYRFAPSVDRRFDTYISRLDWRITQSGSETLFWRGQTQWDKQPGASQFPGQQGATTLLDDSKGSTVGLTSLLTPRLVNEIRWGFVRQGTGQAGASLQPQVGLDGLSSPIPFTRTTAFTVPTNGVTDALTWEHGNHTFKFGTDLLFIRDSRVSYAGSFSDAQTNVAYLNTAAIANTTSPLDPANNGYPAVDPSFGSSYDNATMILLGILSEGDGVYNFNRNGTALAQGAPVDRRYAINDYEFFGEDAWHVKRTVNLTYGLRWVLEAPPYETNGLQIAPCISVNNQCTSGNVADWFNRSATLAAEGKPANGAGELSFELGGPMNHGPGMWSWDHKDVSPRVGVAWSPEFHGRWLAKLFGGKGQVSIRGGYSIMYDHFGIPIVNSFDEHGSFGLSSDIGNPAGVVSPSNAPRFTCLTCLPPPCPSLNGAGCLFGPVPTGGFPYTPSNTAFAINWGLDQSVKTPYAHVFNFSVTRQVTRNSALEIAYVGSIGRRLPMQVDMAQPIDLVDPKSHMDYFTAARMLSEAAAKGTPTSQIAPISFWENEFSQWSTVTQSQLQANGKDCAPGSFPAQPTATQAIYDLWSCFLHNETFSLFLLDTPSSISGVNLPNSDSGPYTFFHDQFSSLTAWRTIGTSDYNALQVTYNAHIGDKFIGQFNYTFSKSLDAASDAGRIGPWEGSGGTGNDLNGGAIVVNAWDPLALRGLSDFNAFHQFNANLVYQLPLGKGQMIDGNASPWVNTLIGGWHTSGIFRWTSGFPTSVDNGFQWPTNWNIEGDAMPISGLPQMRTTSNVIGPNGQSEGPNMFPDPAAAMAAFRPSWPGESGTRNEIIGDGMFNIDTGLSKSFPMGETRQLEFSWQTFNLTNSVRYNVHTAEPSLSYPVALFGKYNSTLTVPRFMQFALRFQF